MVVGMMAKVLGFFRDWLRKPMKHLRAKHDEIRLDAMDENLKLVGRNTAKLVDEAEKGKAARVRLGAWIVDGLFLRNGGNGVFIHRVRINDDVDFHAAQIATTDPRVKATDPMEPKLGDGVTLHLVDASRGNESNADVIRLLTEQNRLKARDLELLEARHSAPTILEGWIHQAKDNNNGALPGITSYRHDSITNEAELAAARMAKSHQLIVKVNPETPKMLEAFSIWVDTRKTGTNNLTFQEQAQRTLEGWAIAGRKLGLAKYTDEQDLINIVGFTIQATINTEVQLEAARLARNAKDMGIISISPRVVERGETCEIVVANPKYIDFGPYPD